MSEVTPRDREEKLLAAIAEGTTGKLPTPRNRKEKLLKEIYDNGGTGGGGVTPAQVKTILLDNTDTALNGASSNPIANKALVAALADYVKSTDLSIPTKVSELINDKKYQTDSDLVTALTPYAKSDDVTAEIIAEIAKVVADAPEDFDTLKEMSDWIAGHEDDASAMNSAISDNKIAITALQTSKADKSEIPTTIAELTDSSDYAKKTDVPTALPANGGNADTVNNHTVKSNVPENAVFTDTTYSDATQIEHGLMSVDDKKKLDGLKKYTPDGTTITADEDGTLHGQSVDIATTEKAGIVKPDGETIEVDADGKISAKTALDTKPTIIATAEPNIVDTLEAPMLVTKATRNLLNPTLQTTTQNGVTCTNNGDGTYTLNGTASINTYFIMSGVIYDKNIINKYEGSKLVGAPSGSSSESFCLYAQFNGGQSTQTIYYDYGNGIKLNNTKGYETLEIIIYVKSGKTVSNLTFKPMITTDLSATYDDFVPYDGYEIKSCGKNLLNPTLQTTTHNGVTCTNNGDGTYTLNGTCTKDDAFILKNNIKINGSYRLVGCPKGEYNLQITSGYPEWIEIGKDTGNGSNFTNSSDFLFDVRINTFENRTYNNVVFKPMLTTDLSATYDDFEPYKDGGTVQITPSTEFPLLGLKSFDGETNIISPGNVEVTYAKNDSGKAILDVMESNETLISNAINHNIPRVVPKDITSYMSDGSFYKRLNGTDGYKLFEDIFVGDYIKMSRAISAPNQDSSVKTIGSQYVTIIGLDTLMGNGDGNSFVNYHHAVMAPGQGFGGIQHFGRHRMNSTNTTEGGYLASEMNTAVIGAVATSGSTTDTATINQQLYAEFGSHLATIRELVTNSINATGTNRLGDASGCSNNCEWASMQAILMSEIEVYGSIAFSSSGYDTGNAKMQMPLFAHNRQAMNNRGSWYWLKDTASAKSFCNCGGDGNVNHNSAISVGPGVRPRFVIKA